FRDGGAPVRAAEADGVQVNGTSTYSFDTGLFADPFAIPGFDSVHAGRASAGAAAGNGSNGSGGGGGGGARAAGAGGGCPRRSRSGKYHGTDAECIRRACRVFELGRNRKRG